MKYHVVIIFLSFIFLQGCVTYKKYPYLLSDGKELKKDTIQLDVLRTEYQLQKGDVLDIKISSTVATDIEIFNKRFEGASVNSNTNPYSNYLSGYIIDNNGDIEMPLMGKIKAMGLTCSQLNDTIQSKLTEYISFSNVTTKLGIFRVTILGEVTTPGTKDIVNAYNLNIYQAIGLAGDVTDVGNKNKVKLVRKNGDRIEVIKLDLGNISMIESKYYYLQPNDVIYVQPLRAKLLRTNSSNIALVLSALTFVIVLLNYTK